MLSYRLYVVISASAKGENRSCTLDVFFLVASDWQINLLLAMVFPGLLLQEDGSRNVSPEDADSYRNVIKEDFKEHVDK